MPATATTTTQKNATSLIEGSWRNGKFQMNWSYPSNEAPNIVAANMERFAADMARNQAGITLPTGAAAAGTTGTAKQPGRPKLSAAARKKISDAQKKRHAAKAAPKTKTAAATA